MVRARDIKAAIFDFDMTLADSSRAIYKCTNLLAARFGLAEVSYEDVLAGIGLKIEDCWRAYWGDYKDEWTEYYRKEFRGVEQENIRLFPNTRKALEALRANGVARAVVSNRRFARRVVDAVGLSQYMDAVVGLEDVTRAKPDPEAILKALSLLCVKPEAAAYVGDTDIDMAAAVAAGVSGVGVTTGCFDGAKLKAAGARFVIADLIELPELLGV